MTISAIFKSPLPSFSFHFKNGMTAVFMNGKFITSQKEQIHELMDEIRQIGVTSSAHPYIYVDEHEQEIDSEALSPMELVRLKAKEEARRELLEEQEIERARAMNINNVSNTDSDAFKTSLANTRTISNMVESGEVKAGVDAVKVNTNTAVPVVSFTETDVPVLDTPVQAVETSTKSVGAKLANLAANLKK